MRAFRLIFFAFLTTSPLFLSGQVVLTNSDIGFLVGDWSGELEYLDYQDNTSRVTLSTDLLIRAEKKGVVLRFRYVEPNGKIIEGNKDKVRVKKGTLQFNGASWEVVNYEDRPGEQFWTLLIQREGKDDDRPATIRQEITREGDRLVMTKTVRYQAGEAFGFRNEYRFNKK